MNSLVEACRPEAASHHITLLVEGTSAPFVVEVDSVRVEQMLWNLVSNALKFAPSGGRVTLALVPEDLKILAGAERKGRRF